MVVSSQYRDHTEKIKTKIRALGADLVGVADTEPLKRLRLDPPSLLAPFPRAISRKTRLFRPQNAGAAPNE